MRVLFVVNSVFSSKTARFWSKHHDYLLNRFDEADQFFPDSNNSLESLNLKPFQVVFVVGSDLFFSNFINALFSFLSENQQKILLSFLPDNPRSAVAGSLGFSGRIEDLCNLAQKRTTIQLDLIRCHYTDQKGFPASHLVINDAVIGVSVLQYPLFLKGGKTMMRFSSLLYPEQKANHMALYEKDHKLFEGAYVFSILLLGNALVNGPRINSRLRIPKSKFDYFQLNPTKFKDLILSNPFNSKMDSKSKEMLQGRFSDLEFKGDGEENQLIIDGMPMGRLPAAFTLLPKALRVVAPLISIPLKPKWKQQVADVKVANPIGQRNLLEKKDRWTA